MNARKLGVIEKGQDGAVFNGYLFRFDVDGSCNVYRLSEISDNSVPICQFVLDKTDVIVPHCNAVMFGDQYYKENDEFPLLYCNIYNSYAKAENKRKGVTCVYRLERNGSTFATTLVQLIEVGFTEDNIWKSANCDDVRPYGNFAIDAENGMYYAFTMRDEGETTRYFSFDLPNINEGILDHSSGVKRVVLGKEDIRSFFDCEYHRYLQGACFHNGIIYSLEGFTDSEINPPAIRFIHVNTQRQERLCYFSDYGMNVEPEFIDFENEICYYADHDGNVFVLNF